MTTPKTILRDSLAAMALLVVVGAMVGGGFGALSVFAGGALTIVNFLAMAWAIQQLFDEEGAAPVAVGLLIVKTTVFLGGMALLMQVLDPMLVGLGLLSLVSGLLIHLVVTLGSQSAWAEEA